VPDTLRDDIMSAMNTSGDATSNEPTTPVSTPSGDTSQQTPSGDTSSSTTSVPELGTPGEQHPSGDGRVRDALGRFARSETDPQPKPTPAPKPDANIKLDPAAKVAADKAAADKAQQDKNASALRAPQALSATEREHWASTPRPIQEAILRREQQVNTVLQNSAGARQFTEMMTNVVNPFLPMIQSTGANPFEFMHGMLQAAALLRSGTAGDKANFIAHLVKQHAIDIQMLDSALAGQPQQQPQGGANGVDPALIDRLVQQRMAPMQQFVSQFEQARQQSMERLQHETVNEMETFANDAQNEFFPYVRDIMADLIEAAGKRGQDMSFAQAYQAACQLHPEIAKVSQQRQAASIARQQHEAAQRARGASVGVRSNPGAGGSGVVAPQDDSLRGAIAAAIAQHQH